MSDAPADPFGTAVLRDAAVRAWQSSPTRLREDANLEEDHARGWYRDRVVVELAQNAADAAAAGDPPGELTLRLVVPPRGGVPASEGGPAGYLVAENTGAPLTAEGVASLASLRASTKSLAPATSGEPPAAASGAPVGAVGRFGVGFAAVRSVSDDVVVLTRDPGSDGVSGVAFSLTRTRELLAEAGLDDRLPGRGEALPVLRLPFPVPADDADGMADAVGAPVLPSTGRTTAVVLALRDDDAVTAARRQLDGLDAALLLALGALDVVHVEAGAAARVLDRDTFSPARGWRVATAHGAVPTELLADRPVEERDRTGWSVTWALPVDDTAPGEVAPGVVHAPTPTADRTSLPGVLVATLPLDATRRHVVEGPLAEHVAREAGALFARTVAEVARDRPRAALSLVPGGVPAGWVDAVVQEAAIEALRDAPLFDGTPAREAVAIQGPVGADGVVVDALRPALHGLVVLPPSARAAARLLGVSVRPLADVVEDLAPGLPPGGWGKALAALAPYATDPGVREALAALPVPVVPAADAPGAVAVTVRGARGVVAGAAPDAVLDAFRAWGVPAVHPDAAHPVLHDLGALAPDDPAVLDLPAVRAAILRAADDTDEPDDDAAAHVLAVVGAVRRAHPAATLPRSLAAVLLPALDRETGEPAASQPAGDLAVPGTWAADVLDLDLLDVGALLPAAGAGTADLAADAVALGAHADLDVVVLRDVVLPSAGEDATLPDGLDDLLGDDVLDHLETLADRVGGGTLVDELDVVVPLDAVPDDATAEVVRHVLADPRLRAALLARPLGEPSHLAGWVRARLGAPFTVPAAVAAAAHVPFVPGLDATAPDVAGLDDALADPRVAEALGAVRSLAELDVDALGDVLDRVADRAPDDEVPLADAAALWRAVRSAASGGAVWDPPPDRVLALVLDDAGRPRARVVEPADVRVGSGPHAAVLGPVVPASPDEAGAVADALDLDLQPDDVAPDREAPAADGEVRAGSGDGRPWDLPASVAALVPGLAVVAVRHEHLVVAGHRVPWWVTRRADGPGDAPDVVVHATTTDGLARGLALAAGDWTLRHALAAALADPSAADALVAETAWD
ncbi:sacsin N-terminal ATP-binding-like domain-containing protein [Luteimicrobium sp. NPDC057192]|uniref:sacsin N-terminal ATP-binding-like domain-containing protein n=1 Tax=Luteimicrobium sp. NPDC057192 TaxID=3346042 RepID=UPI0036283AB3